MGANNACAWRMRASSARELAFGADRNDIGIGTTRLGECLGISALQSTWGGARGVRVHVYDKAHLSELHELHFGALVEALCEERLRVLAALVRRGRRQTGRRVRLAVMAVHNRSGDGVRALVRVRA